MWTYYLIIFEINLYDLQPLFLFLSLGVECFTNDLLKISLCWDHGKQKRGSESCWQGETLAERLHSSIGLPGGVCSPYPVNSLNCTLQRPFPPGSVQAPPGYSMERIYHREKSILKFSFSPPSFSHPSTPLSLPSLSFFSTFSLSFYTSLSLFLFFFCLFFWEDLHWADFPKTRNLSVCPSTKHSDYKCALPQPILFPTLNSKLKLSSLLLQKTSKEHTCQHGLGSGIFRAIDSLLCVLTFGLNDTAVFNFQSKKYDGINQYQY